MALTIDGTNGIETNTDTGKIKVGTDDDLQIYHDGTDSTILNKVGHLRITNEPNSKGMIFATSNTNRYQIGDTGHFLPIANNSYDIGQTDYRIRDLYVANDISLKDDGKLMLGNSDDLLMYFDGTHSYISNGGDDLFIKSADHVIIRTNNSENAVVCNKNGAVELYHDNTKKFHTSASGFDVPDGSGYTNRTSGSNKGWYVQHDGTTVARLFQNGTGPEGILELLNNGTQKILVNGDNGTYYGVNTSIQAVSSERRTKENITSIDDTKSWSTLKDIKLYNFSYKNDTNSDTHYGPIVDEIPTDMKVPTSNSDDVGVINTYNSELLLFRAYSTIKQLVAKVETLETKVAALEAA